MAKKRSPKRIKDRWSPDAVHGSGLEIDEDGSWDKLATLKIEHSNLEMHIGQNFNVR